MMYDPSVDVIIPAYRPDDKLMRLIDGLLRQKFPVQKLIIVNTGEELMPREIRERLAELDSKRSSCFEKGAELIHIQKSEFDHAFARNLGVSHSEADIFICMTDDAEPVDTELTSELVKAFSYKGREGETVAEAYGRQLPRKGCSRKEAYTRSFNYPPEAAIKTWKDRERLGIKTCFASNVCCAYRRDIFDRLGGFLAPAIFNEDMVYASSVIEKGYAIAYVSQARVFHSHSYSPMQQLRRNFDLGLSQRQHKEIFSAYSSESEGARLVLSTASELVSDRAFLELPGLFTDCAFKYAGYLLGKNSQRLPMALVKRLSSDPRLAECIIRSMSESR